MTDRAGREAFLERYRETQAAVHAYLLRACAGERGRAEDLTQETYSAALVAWRAGRNEQVTLPWLLTVARNKLVDEYRKLDREAQRLPSAPWAREQSHRDDPAHVLECIRALPPMQRARDRAAFRRRPSGRRGRAPAAQARGRHRFTPAPRAGHPSHHARGERIMIESQIRDALQEADAGARPEFGAELEARLADEFDGVEGVAELVDMTSRRPRRWALATTGIAAALAVVLGVGVLARGGNDGSVTATTTVSLTPKQQAQALAAKMLGGLTLPPRRGRARRLPRRTTDVHRRAVDDRPNDESVDRPDVGRQHRRVSPCASRARAWMSRRPERSAAANHSPRSRRPFPTVTPSSAVDFVLSADGGQTRMTAEARVTWYPPRSLAEHIPARDKVVTVDLRKQGFEGLHGRADGRTGSSRSSSRRTLRSTAFVSCPSMSSHPGHVHTEVRGVTFRPARCRRDDHRRWLPGCGGASRRPRRTFAHRLRAARGRAALLPLITCRSPAH